MNLELLEKLVRLANNNSNDNEANLAARKVCKMIWNEEKNRLRIQNSINDIKSATEQQKQHTWNYKPTREQEDFFGFDLNELFKNIKYANQQQYYKWNSYESKKEQEKPKRNLKCTKCNNTINTAFVGNPDFFVCITCVWQKYQEEKEENSF